MSSYAENEQDAREYAELQRQFKEERDEEKRKDLREVNSPDYNAFFRLAKEQVEKLDIDLPIVIEMLDYGQSLHLRQQGFTQPMLCGGCEEVVMKDQS